MRKPLLHSANTGERKTERGREGERESKESERGSQRELWTEKTAKETVNKV